MANLGLTETPQQRIVVIAADPEATSSDLLNEEVSVISEAFGDTKNGRPTIVTAKTTDQAELVETMLEFRPTIVHFTGHGSPSGSVILEDAAGWLRNVTGPTLGRVVAQVSPRPQCFVLNGCRVSRKLSFLRFVADHVISICPRSGGVDISPVVSRTLYQRIGGGLGYAKAFQLLITQLAEMGFLGSLQANFFRGEQPSNDVLARLRGGDDSEFDQVASFESMDPVAHIAKSEIELEQKRAGRRESRGPSTAPADEIGPRTYRVWFGTNRALVDSGDPNRGFGSERGSETHCGCCDVSIPKYHVIGSVGESWWKRFPRFWQNNRLRVQSIRLLQAADYWRGIKAEFDGLTGEDRVLLIFVHGYRVNFSEAIVRAAQLGMDLGIRGATGLFSWPS